MTMNNKDINNIEKISNEFINYIQKNKIIYFDKTNILVKIKDDLFKIDNFKNIIFNYQEEHLNNIIIIIYNIVKVGGFV